MRFSLSLAAIALTLAALCGCDCNKPRHQSSKDVSNTSGECLSCKDAKKQESKTYDEMRKDQKKTHRQCQDGKCTNSAPVFDFGDSSTSQPNLPPATAPPATQASNDPPVTTPPTTTPPSAIVQSNIGDYDPAVPLNAADQAIVDSVINGSKDLDNRRNRVFVAGDNFPGTPAQLTYCVFDTTVRDLLGVVKKYGANPADIRAPRDADCTAANLKKHIDWIFADIQPNDFRVGCLSCHGSADTDSNGNITGIVCTYDMIKTGIWDETTEITLAYWKEKCKSVPKGCNVVLIFDLCHAGGDIRALLSNQRTPRSTDGPAPVQARLAKATTRLTLRDVNQYNVQFIPMCLDSELSEEGPGTGGLGTWALWSAVDKNGSAAPCTTLIRDTNGNLRTRGATQHVVVVGANAKAPMGQAVK